MEKKYKDVITRFLQDEERLITSQEKELPLVIEADQYKDLPFLQSFLKENAQQITEDIAQYGAVLLRGFDIQTEIDFEEAVLSIPSFRGISEAFMSEEGRVPVGELRYVLHTNAVYKTGGTLYLGGFHSENYYSPDVPGYICFCCFKPSKQGGETGLVNMEKVYPLLAEELKESLAARSFFVTKWRLAEAAERYELTEATVKALCKQFNLPVIGEGKNQFILMYKPSIYDHPLTQKKSLQINFLELTQLNAELRKCFKKDYAGKDWFWHRFVWGLPPFLFNTLAFFYITIASFSYSPKNALQILCNKFQTFLASKKETESFDTAKVAQCFSNAAVQELAKLMRNYYSSCLWKKGDILLIDNRKVVHAGMPGLGPRLIRAFIANPLAMEYTANSSGVISGEERFIETIGYYMRTGKGPKAV